MFDFILAAGFGIFPVMAFGVAAIIVAVRHVLHQRAGSDVTVKWLMALTGASGLLGTVTGVQMSARHIHEIPEKWIFLLGLDESLNNMVAALILIAIAMLAMLVAHVRNGSEPSRSAVPAPTA